MRHSPWPRPSKYAFANSLQSALKLDERGLLHSYLTWRKIRQMDHFLPLILGGSGCKSAVAGLFEIWRRHDCHPWNMGRPHPFNWVFRICRQKEYLSSVHPMSRQDDDIRCTEDESNFWRQMWNPQSKDEVWAWVYRQLRRHTEQIPRRVVFLGFGGHFWASRRTIPHCN